MSVEEENEVDSVGSMPPLIVRSKVEASGKSSGESRSSKNIDRISEDARDKGREAERRGFNDVLDMWIFEWSDDFAVNPKIKSVRRETKSSGVKY